VEARAAWAQAWNAAKRAGLKPPMLDRNWTIDEISEQIALLSVSAEPALTKNEEE